MKEKPLFKFVVTEVEHEGFTIRKIQDDDKTYFVVDDLLKAFEDDDHKTWKRLKQRIQNILDRSEFKDLIKTYAIGKETKQVVGPTGAFRLVQSIRSNKAERFRRLIAEAAFEHAFDEINPEAAINRAIGNLKKRGMTDEWIHLRLRSITVRKGLTDELHARGSTDREYGIHTNEIYKGTFGHDAKSYRSHKELGNNDNLRDHMTEMELALTMLAEQTAMEIARQRDTQGFNQNNQACKEGGKIAGTTRDSIEKTLHQSVVSKQNFKHLARELD